MVNLSSFAPPNIPHIVDVVRDFGAVGDAIIAPDGTVTGTDNTAAFVAAIRAAQPVGGTASNSFGHWLYVPPGRFMVSDKLEWRNTAGTYGSCIRVIGEHIDVSEIVLKDAASGYGSAGAPKPVFLTAGQGSPAGNSGYKNAFHNVTVTVGASNPGAIAIDMSVNNTGGMKNVRIRSVDPGRVGVSGLSLTRAWPGPAHFDRVTVEGFGVGVDVASFQYSVTFEHLMVKDQLTVGVRNASNVVPIRDLISTQVDGVPAVQNVNTDSFTTIIDAELSGIGGTTAIDNAAGGFMRLRGIRSAGYTNKLANKPVGGSTVTYYTPSQLDSLDEFTNGPVTTLHTGQRLTSLRLPAMEAPEYYDTNSADWANVMDFGVVHGLNTDQSTGVQAAMDSGASTVYFPAAAQGTSDNDAFLVTRQITIPPTVKRIVAMMSTFAAKSWTDGTVPVFNILPCTDDPLFIENMWCGADPSQYPITNYTDAVLAASSPTVTSASAAFTSAWIGRAVADITNDALDGIPASTFITAVPNATTITLSNNATVTGTRNIRTGNNVDPTGGLKGAPWIDHRTSRPLILNEVILAGGHIGIVVRSGAGPVFLKSCYIGFHMEPGTRVWGRGLNCENPVDRRITNDGGDLWVFGLKTEQYGTNIKTTNGGRTELEGGYMLPTHPDWSKEPAFECVDAQHSLSFTGFAYQQYHAFYGTQVRETKAGVTRNLLHTDTVKRVNGWSDVVPLHIGRLV